MSTRSSILDAALELFNDRGKAAVSTNHIAAALDIGPGNLYYHFRIKQDIIQALFERLFAAWDVRLFAVTGDSEADSCPPQNDSAPSV
jgi:AcrR family transcriptional regulator